MFYHIQDQEVVLLLGSTTTVTVHLSSNYHVIKRIERIEQHRANVLGFRLRKRIAAAEARQTAFVASLIGLNP